MKKQYKIAVAGTGYVGLSIATASQCYRSGYYPRESGHDQ